MQLRFSTNAKSMIFVCADSKFSSVLSQLEPVRNMFVNCVNRGIKYKLITEITKDNILYCKEILKIISPDELRHLDKLKGSYAVNESEFLATSTLHELQPLPKVVYSNVKEIVELHQFLFETLWDKSIPAEQKIREIEEDLKPHTVELIQNSNRSKELYLDLVNSAKKEIMIIFPTLNAFVRQKKLGIMQSFRKAAKERNVKVRILMPRKNFTENGIGNIKENSGGPQSDLEDDDNQTILPIDIVHNIDVRHIEQMSATKSTVLIIDKSLSLVMELKDDSKPTFVEAVGLSTYSNSTAGVLSYVSIFESLWVETELYEHLRIHDKMQKEFINVAAHELRTPAQSILGFSGLLKKHPEIKEELVTGIYRNAQRLQRLINNILDVTAIESQSLILDKEQFDLNEVISNVVDDYRNQIKKTADSNIKLIHNDNDAGNSIVVVADKERTTQVISNLVDNAIKFTKYGDISVTCKVEKNGDDEKEVIVTVKDTGSGINSEISPKLFSKFATKSFQGTGLGLFISKSIVEIHGGRIWAENNDDGVGGTKFTFSLPLKDNAWREGSGHEEG